jgi:hypothetical protein
MKRGFTEIFLGMNDDDYDDKLLEQELEMSAPLPRQHALISVVSC